MKRSSLSLLIPCGAFLALGSFGFAKHHQQQSELEQKIIAALPDKLEVQPEEERLLLVFSKTNGFRHGSIETGKLCFTHLGEKTGAFKAVVSDDLSNFEPENIKKFAAICFLNTTNNVFSPSKKEKEKMSEEEKKKAKAYSDELKKSFMSYIKGGGGFVGIHAATDTFYGWKEYGEMINGYFWGHPWSAGTPVSIKVEPGQEKHPLVEMFGGENIEFKEEIYQLNKPYDSSKVNMLLRLDTEKTTMEVKGIHRKDNDFGVAWHRPWGEGRVFYCSLGHNHHIYHNQKVLKHYLAGIRYAIGDLKLEN